MVARNTFSALPDLVSWAWTTGATSAISNISLRICMGDSRQTLCRNFRGRSDEARVLSDGVRILEDVTQGDHPNETSPFRGIDLVRVHGFSSGSARRERERGQG